MTFAFYLQLFTYHLHYIRHGKYSRDDLKYMEFAHRLSANTITFYKRNLVVFGF